MRYVVTLDREVDFAPQNDVAEILQNVRTILATVVGSVPLDRDFGVSWDFVDMPIPKARIMIKQSIIEAIEKYEDRVTLQEVEFYGDSLDTMDGISRPRVIVSIGNDDEDEEI